MITGFLNLFRKTPKVGEFWLVNGPGSNALEARVTRVTTDNVYLIVDIFNSEILFPIAVSHKDFHNILKIKRISK